MTSDNSKYKTSPPASGCVPKVFNRGMTTLPASLMDVIDPIEPLFPFCLAEQLKETKDVVEETEPKTEGSKAS